MRYLGFSTGKGVSLGWVCAGVLALATSPSLAQSPLGAQPLAEADQAAWQAIGQITYGGPPGRAICTATLVAADLVLTAGHCLAVHDAPMQPGDVQFAAGWRAGHSVAVRHGKAILLAQPTTGQPRSLSQDLALLVLDAPISADLIQPLPLGRQDLFAETYTFIGYRRDAPGIPERDTSCDLAGTAPGVLQLSCPVVSGNSGAPVLMERHGHWQVAAVMVARAGDGGAVHAFAAIPGDDLRARINVP